MAFKRSSKDISHARKVYTVLEFFGDVGGLNDSMTLIALPILSIWTPGLFARSILNNSFSYQSSGRGDKRNRSRRQRVKKSNGVSAMSESDLVAKVNQNFG